MTHNFQITAAPGSRGEVRIDGNRLDCVRGFTLTADVHSVPRLELDLRVFEGGPVSGEAIVTVPPSTHDALIALGWTPPHPNGDPK